MDKFVYTRNLILLAYQDYIAARLLINHEYVIQGVTLASTAIEKYLKALLILIDKPTKKVHLDNLVILKRQFENTEYITLFDYLDESFLMVLGKAYQFRYYDNIKSAETIGFFINQFLGELDYTFCVFETLLQTSNWKTPYEQDRELGRQDLFENNYILLKLPKKEFMQRETQAYALYIDPKYYEPVDVALKEKLPILYEGKIMLIEVRFNK